MVSNNLLEKAGKTSESVERANSATKTETNTMVEKFRLGGAWSLKKWFAAVLFGIIILVFTFWGISPSSLGDAAGGVAAVVNDRSISVSEFRNQAEQVEHNARSRFDALPESQRKAMTTELRRRVLDQLIMTEVIYQAAAKRGVTASDGEVKDQILQIPFLQENGRFMGERYRMFLKNMNLSAEDFERQIRKQIVTEKLQELFVGSAAPTREELRLNRLLANQKVSLRFAEIAKEGMARLAIAGSAEVADFAAKHADQISAYYKDNLINYTEPEKYHARDILIRIDQKRPEAEARKQIEELAKQATPKNFAALAAKHSEDPGSKAKGGDLGERPKGSLLADFEQAALALKPGEVSAPVKLEGGYHLIYLVSRTDGGTKPLETVKNDIARTLMAESKRSEVVDELTQAIQKGGKKAFDGWLAKAGVKWQESGEFDLSSTVIPKLGDAKDVMPFILEQGRKTGLVPRLIPYRGGYLAVDITAWHQAPDSDPEVEGLDRMVAYRKAEGAIEAWAREAEARASIQKNQQVLR